MVSARRKEAWTGELDLAASWGLFVGSGASTARHAHFAHKLVVARGADTSVIDGEALAAGAWLVRSGVEHQVLAGEAIALLFVDAGAHAAPDRVAARDRIAEPLARTIEILRASDDAAERVDAARDLVSSLVPLADDRAARAAAQLLDDPTVATVDLADEARLSATRLAHVFRDQIGVAPRQYRTWALLRRALAGMASGEPLTRIAHDAGFADSAHLSRTFTRMLGIPPSAIAGSCVFRSIE
jgi:AraC-like DNA-binding protein